MGAKKDTILYRYLIGGFKKIQYTTILIGGLKRLNTPQKHIVYSYVHSFQSFTSFKQHSATKINQFTIHMNSYFIVMVGRVEDSKIESDPP